MSAMRLPLLLAVLGIAAGPAIADRAVPPQDPAAPPPPPPPPRNGFMRPPQPMPRPPVPRPAPPPEVAALAKRLAGTYTCKGVQLAPTGASTPLTATLVVKLAVGDAWLQMTLTEPKAHGLGFEDFRTYDPIAKEWTRLQVASSTAHTVWTSLGESGGSWSWDGTATSPSGSMQRRDHETPGDRQLFLWGEALLGGGWQKLYEVTCKR